MRLPAFLLLGVLAATAALGAPPAPRPAAKNDKCPVCGMFVAKYPDFASQIQFRDGTVAHFDGAKDMFTFFLSPGKYAPGRKKEDVAAIHVTDYYSLKPIDAFKAFYVIGSNVFGPMGKELVPLATKEAAAEFLKDHQGKKILRFSEVLPAVVDTLK